MYLIRPIEGSNIRQSLLRDAQTNNVLLFKSIKDAKTFLQRNIDLPVSEEYLEERFSFEPAKQIDIVHKVTVDLKIKEKS